MNPLLVLDCHFLCHRAFHSQRDLSYGGIATGAIFGFLKSIGHLKKEFQTDRVAFCFEGATLYRKVWFPEYKMGRVRRAEKELADGDVEKIKARGDLVRQIDILRSSYLRQIGFRNIFYYPGWESDDIMARICQKVEGEIILVTSDEDMFQCLRPNVTMFSPQKNQMFTDVWFRKTYGIGPEKWALVKAIAGCGTDNVPGVPGVGEITALKFVRGEGTKEETIMAHREIVLRNRKLVELPMEDPPTPNPEWSEDLISQKGWDDVCRRLGIQSLMGRAPVFSRRYLKL